MQVMEFDYRDGALARRMQTLAALHSSCMFLFQGFSLLFLFGYLLFTKYFYIPAIYILWYAFDRKQSVRGSRSSTWIRNMTIWKYFREYFPIELIKTTELKPDKNYILGYHPHGIMSIGAFTNFALDEEHFKSLFPGIRPILLTLSGQFKFPLHRELLMSLGLCEASKDSFDWLLTKEGVGNALVLVTGGASEALEAHSGQYTLNLKNRKGFIKIALKYGASLVPVFSFGENNAFGLVPNPEGSNLKKFQKAFVKYFGFGPALFTGRGVLNYSMGFLPSRGPMYTVVGEPLTVNQCECPSQEDIDALHQRYIDSVIHLFEKHKHLYGVGEMKHINVV